MSFFIDRRKNAKNKSAVNRQRFIRRYRTQIRKAVEKNLKSRSIMDVEGGEKVSIPQKDTSEPLFHHGQGGRQTYVMPGNREFTQGDKFPRQGGSGSGSGKGAASDKGEGLDEFVFNLSREEFLNFLFENMALPNLSKRQLSGTDEFKRVRAGYSSEGSPGNISIVRSMQSSTARRIALGASKRRELRELEAELKALADGDAARAETLQCRIDELRQQLARIPFLDDIDIRYHRQQDEPTPHSQAVMFCLMDVSGSMDQVTKDLAKRFFILLYLFLSRNYEKTDVVFIRHHTRAEEVNEEDFFYSRETGGTVVSTALALMQEIIADRYPATEWNIYGSQASDGDNWPEDSQRCYQLLAELLPSLQYYAYIEISPDSPKPLWATYDPLRAIFPSEFAMETISSAEDIYPVFHELFSKETT